MREKHPSVEGRIIEVEENRFSLGVNREIADAFGRCFVKTVSQLAWVSHLRVVPGNMR